MTCNCKLANNRRFEGLPSGLSPRIFAGMAAHDVAEILSAARHHKFHSACTVTHAGDPAENVFLLTSGRGTQFVSTAQGEKIVVHWITAGQLFGGAGLLSNPGSYLASTELLTPGCALVWNRRPLRQMALRFATLLDNALSISISEHVAWQLACRVSIGTEDARTRLARLLVALSCGIGKPAREGVSILVANDVLASAASVTPYTVSRILSEWQRAGIVFKQRGRILLRHPELLTAQL